MRTLRTIDDVRAAVRDGRRQGRAIGLVPTMGALHEGHLALIRRARSECDTVVVSIFVNPAQFNEAADLEAYPRTGARDAELAAAAGADVLFVPAVAEVYPPGFSASVQITGPLTDTLEGSERGSAHFHGVTTVVTKLFNIVAPDVAYFGQKDAQQALVICKLVKDLDLPVRVEVCPTIREADGLAMSSRNVRLSQDERSRAVALRRALDAAEVAAASGEHDPAAVLAAARAVLAEFDVEPEYVALVDTDTLAPVTEIDGEVLIAIAACVGDTRLIDNTLVRSAEMSLASAQLQPTNGRAS
jgi:pantoate--beta-alanine ligase